MIPRLEHLAASMRLRNLTRGKGAGPRRVAITARLGADPLANFRRNHDGTIDGRHLRRIAKVRTLR